MINVDENIYLERYAREISYLADVKDNNIRNAFRIVPRSRFIPQRKDYMLAEIYSDDVIPLKISDGKLSSSSSQPSLMAYMLERAEISPGDNVLEIGTATGYDTAIISAIVGSKGRVTSIEYDEMLAGVAKDILRSNGYDNCLVISDDGGKGYPLNAPYDEIVVTVGIYDLTRELLKQLKERGRIVAPFIYYCGESTPLFKLQRKGNILRGRFLLDSIFVHAKGRIGTPEYDIRKYMEKCKNEFGKKIVHASSLSREVYNRDFLLYLSLTEDSAIFDGKVLYVLDDKYGLLQVSKALVILYGDEVLLKRLEYAVRQYKVNRIHFNNLELTLFPKGTSAEIKGDFIVKRKDFVHAFTSAPTSRGNA
ncbi:MAG: protein-L-isoaspartate O-methyltransferase [Thermotogae bacterium]|nr:protein-L-isoaspartate O-methyltransferase [Thermotogota bacterium]